MTGLLASLALLRSHPDWPNDRDVCLFNDDWCPQQSVYVAGETAFANRAAMMRGLSAVAVFVLTGPEMSEIDPESISYLPFAVLAAREGR